MTAWELQPSGVPSGADLVAPRIVTRAIRWLVFLGVAACSVRFLLKFPLFMDEWYLAIHFAERGYSELLGPLDYCVLSVSLHDRGRSARYRQQSPAGLRRTRDARQVEAGSSQATRDGPQALRALAPDTQTPIANT